MCRKEQCAIALPRSRRIAALEPRSCATVTKYLNCGGQPFVHTLTKASNVCFNQYSGYIWSLKRSSTCINDLAWFMWVSIDRTRSRIMLVKAFRVFLSQKVRLSPIICLHLLPNLPSSSNALPPSHPAPRGLIPLPPPLLPPTSRLSTTWRCQPHPNPAATPATTAP